ncbi:hypothetical protein [Eilatimonas milleporae]|uniref:Phage replication protein O n=1 Tax=Eilatimonas milleporae TaxID=911205 RepID=A0A3M0CQY3_9PROT|nr:hypothetical protein [Eilatimonas milleporae]RMB11888.1 hypothetical protein BXY39_0375 [Eilatimonas milleporae]
MRDFGKVMSSVWDSERFNRLGDDAWTKLVFHYLLTCRHGNSIGCFRLKPAYVAADMGLDTALAEHCLSRLDSTGLIVWDRAAQVVMIRRHLDINRITNRNHGAGAAKAALSLPACPAKTLVIREILTSPYLAGTPEQAVLKALLPASADETGQGAAEDGDSRGDRSGDSHAIAPAPPPVTSPRPTPAGSAVQPKKTQIQNKTQTLHMPDTNTRPAPAKTRGKTDTAQPDVRKDGPPEDDGTECRSQTHSPEKPEEKRLTADGAGRQRNTDGAASTRQTEMTALAFAAYNEAAARHGWPKALRLSPRRKSALKARLTDAGGLDGWSQALARAGQSDFLCGRRTDFRASLDFFCQESSFLKLLEGQYDPRLGPRPGPKHSGGSSFAGATVTVPTDPDAEWEAGAAFALEHRRWPNHLKPRLDECPPGIRARVEASLSRDTATEDSPPDPTPPGDANPQENMPTPRKPAPSGDRT